MEKRSAHSGKAGQSWLERVERLLTPFRSKAGSIWLYGAAAVLPFGWVLLLAQAIPVRALTRSLRSRLDSSPRI